MSASRDAFLAALPFPADRFQLEAIASVDAGRSVLVSAPTGAGKTLVAAYGVHRALAQGGKAFYTTPLKALSNQKYAELAHAHGPSRVGLLTGDTSVNPGAAVVVMTTEVLRNMLLAGSDLLDGLQTVVLDEVHYLQDPYRGGVWEEVLVLTPPHVAFICLSATVGNAPDLRAWLASVRGATDLVEEDRRPVELRHHVAVVHRGAGGPAAEPELLPLFEDGRPGAEALRLDQTVARTLRARPPHPGWRGGRGGGPPLPLRTPRRTQVVQALDELEYLPAIVFIFSRAACDDAVRQCLHDGLRLTDQRQRRAIRHIAEEHTAGLADEDLAVLGYGEWLEGLEAGVAAHHAGLVPAFRETVESCFAADLLHVVFATETLSLGINMPARSVVIERFTKFGGAGRATLTSAEYAQLTGRAGRRGLDPEGHAVVLWTPETTVAEVARVAAAPPPDLRSAFRPTYNLAVNLVRRFDRPTALAVLQRSFAEWQAAARLRARTGGRSSGEGLVQHLGRRLAALEELGYVRDWHLTPAGLRLSRMYHDADLLLAEAVGAGVLDGAEPSVVAGVLSALVFERRRARRIPGAGTHREARKGGGRGRGGRRGRGGDRIGAGRRADLEDRLAVLSGAAERIRGVEEVHLVPRTRSPEPGLAGAVTSWARGAPLGATLEVAAHDVGEIAPGDFVRTVKQVADLAGQVAEVAGAAGHQADAEAAREAVRRLLRDVVAAGVPGASATAGGAPP